jgi:hypothetical protein
MTPASATLVIAVTATTFIRRRRKSRGRFGNSLFPTLSMIKFIATPLFQRRQFKDGS